MKINKTTFCGRCGHAGVSRQERISRDNNDVRVAFYVCDSPNCDRAEGTIVQGFKKTLRSRRGYVGMMVVIKKEYLDEDYPLYV